MIELVYLNPLQELDTSGKWPVYKYQKLNGTSDTNIRSGDKEKYSHCYDELETGSSYVIVSENKGKKRGRWVWTYAIKMPPQWLPKFRSRIAALDPKSQVPGYRVTSQEIIDKAIVEVKMLMKVERDSMKAEQTMRDHREMINALFEWD